MNLEVKGHEVLKVEDVVTETQTAIVKTHYDCVIHTEIVVPDTIPIGQSTTVRVLCKNYQDELLTEETTPVLVEVNGVTQEFIPVNGAIEFELTCDVPGDINIKTTVDLWRNAEVVVKGV